MDSSPEASLVSAARAGDPAAMEALLESYERRIYRFGLRMCGNEADAHDVLQETLLAAFKGLRTFRADASLSTWLFQIARSFCTKAHRLGAGEPPQKLGLDAPDVAGVTAAEPLPDAHAQARELGAALHAAMMALPLGQREVILLRDVEGLSAEETAQVLQLEIPAVKSRLHRARAAVRGHLATLLEAPGTGGGVPCPELVQELSDYASADIDQAACARIQAHLERCPGCTAACESLKKTVKLCGQLPGGELPEAVHSAVWRAVRSLSAG